MAKWSGIIAYSIQKETEPGVWVTIVDEHKYTGELKRNFKRNQSTGVNSDISVSNEISVIADPFAYENFHSIEYVTFMGVRWEVTSVDVAYPRLNISLGGVYNGPANRSPKDVGEDIRKP